MIMSKENDLSMIALVDCNNFYVSCERVFQPLLEGKPVIVLSNNDGCIISRSNEAKKLGIKMGASFFEVESLCKKYNVHVFSSNYALYADMSSRVMTTLKQFGIRQEIYSIDESFIDLTGILNLGLYGKEIKNVVKKYTGIPVGVGVGQTKVLAKFANYLAKKYVFLDEVCNLNELGVDRTNKAMQITPINEIWGIGKKTTSKLNSLGIKTVYDLKICNFKYIRDLLNVNIEKIIHELNGIKCLELEEYAVLNKEIVSSRSFGTGVTCINDLLSSISNHLERGSAKLRSQNLFARKLTFFINTNRFHDDYCCNTKTILLPQALDSFRYMAKYVEDVVQDLYIPNIVYKKSGVIFSDLVSINYESVDLFDHVNISHDPILPSIELIKKKFGKSSINLAMSLLSSNWKMQENHGSKHFTTSVNDLIVAK